MCSTCSLVSIVGTLITGRLGVQNQADTITHLPRHHLHARIGWKTSSIKVSHHPSGPRKLSGISQCEGLWRERYLSVGESNHRLHTADDRIGDGFTDDTVAINNAISSGGRCAPGSCQSSTTSPAIVYFPAGTYLLTRPLIDYYETQLIGNPNCLPVLMPTVNFTNPSRSIGVIDGSLYGANGLGFGATNTFYRQVRNFVIDMTNVPANSSITGIHWPTAQATSLQNIVFQMSDAPGTQHVGIYIEEGKLSAFLSWNPYHSISSS